MRFRGEEVAFSSPRDAQHAGIATIYQEVHLAPQMSVARNLFLGRETDPVSARSTCDAMNREAGRCLERYGIAADVRRPLGELGLGSPADGRHRPGRHIRRSGRRSWTSRPPPWSRARSTGCSKSSALLKSEDVAIVYVCHQLDEVYRACDTVTVLRDGKLVATGPTEPTHRAVQLISRHARSRRCRARRRRT